MDRLSRIELESALRRLTAIVDSALDAVIPAPHDGGDSPRGSETILVVEDESHLRPTRAARTRR